MRSNLFASVLGVCAALLTVPASAEPAVAPASSTQRTRPLDWRELMQQGQAWVEEGRLKEAQEPLHRAFEMTERLFGPHHPNTAESARSLAVLEYELGHFDRVETLLRKSLAILERSPGIDRKTLAVSQQNLATILEIRGARSEAEQLHLRSLALMERALPPEDPALATNLFNLANLYRQAADYGRADPLYARALRLLEKTEQTRSNGFYAQVLANLGVMRARQGDLGQAEALLQRAVEINEQVLGPAHTGLAESLGDLAEVLAMMGRHDSALAAARRSLSINGQAVDQSQQLVLAPMLTLIGTLLHAQGIEDEALGMHLRSLDLVEHELGPSHRMAADVLKNLGDLYRDTGRVAEASQAYGRSLSIRKRALGPEHPVVSEGLFELAALAWAHGHPVRARTLFDQAALIQERHLRLALASGPERQQRLFLETLRASNDFAISLHLHGAPQDPAMARLALLTVLRSKGRVLEAAAESMGLLHQTASAQDKARLDKLRKVRSERAHLMLAALDTSNNTGAAVAEQSYKARTTELVDQERALLSATDARRAGSIAEYASTRVLDRLQRLLPEDTALIEWVSYRPFDPRAARAADRFGPPRYAAYVFRAHGHPVGVDLGEAGPINDVVDGLRRALSDPDSNDADALARQLHDRIEAPLAPHLVAAKRLLLAPDRELNLVPLAVLQDEQSRRLLERFAVSYLTSGREVLAWHRPSRSAAGPVLLVAAPDFDTVPEASSPIETSSRASGAPPVARRLRGSSLPWPFTSLPATLDEVHAIRRLVPDARVLVGAQANKTALGSVRSPAIVHIATHGFYVDDPLGDGEANPEDALLRSGLALAGANQRGDAQENGVLTAMELASLDLRGTQLAVLSACETGIGEIRGGEGVYGLRRALAMAGAKSQLVSLWKVDDESTRDLMSRYYSNLMRHQDRVEALRQVQLVMMRRPPPYDHPYYWASFISAGAWGPLQLSPTFHQINPTFSARGATH